MSPRQERSCPRVKPPKSFVVAWQSGVIRDVSYVENLALGGLLLRTKSPAPLRSSVQLLMDMPIGQVRGRAVVRRVYENSGMAVQIIAMDPEDRARLSRQLRDFLPSST